MEGRQNGGAERAAKMKRTKCLATAGIVTGSIGIGCCCCGIPAIALGGVACCHVKIYEKNVNGLVEDPGRNFYQEAEEDLSRELAVASVILGPLAIAFAALGIILYATRVLNWDVKLTW